jgi:hypothetical protein
VDTPDSRFSGFKHQAPMDTNDDDDPNVEAKWVSDQREQAASYLQEEHVPFQTLPIDNGEDSDAQIHSHF